MPPRAESTSGRAAARRARCPRRAWRRTPNRSDRRRPRAPRRRLRRQRAGSTSSGERSSTTAARNCASRTSPEPTPETGSTCGANARIRRVLRPTRRSAKQPFSSVMRTLRAPISAIASSAIRKSSSSSSSWPTSCSASRWFGETRIGARLDAQPEWLALRCRARRARRAARGRGSRRRRTSSRPCAEATRRGRRSRRRARGSGASP